MSFPEKLPRASPGFIMQSWLSFSQSCLIQEFEKPSTFLLFKINVFRYVGEFARAATNLSFILFSDLLYSIKKAVDS